MSWDDAEPTVRTPRDPADPEPTRELIEPTTELPTERPIAGPVVPPEPDTPTTPAAPWAAPGPQAGDSPAVSALTPPSAGAGASPIPQPGSNQPYRQSTPGRSTTQRSFGRPEAQEPFRPVYQGQAWPTYQPTYTPPPPLDWHNQQARAYTGSPPPKNGRVYAITAIVALVVALVAGGGTAGLIVALDRNNGSVDESNGPAIGVGTDPKIRSGSVSAVANTLLPSVVQLKVEGSNNSAATGSGFVIDSAGHILTNNHVVAGAAAGGSIQVVTQQGKTSTARLVGRSPAYDLAVVQVAGLEAPSVQFAAAAAVVGQDVVAIGSPLGLAGTVTSGIISAKDRPVIAGDQDSPTEISYINALQTDAAINPGNSGGPLVDMNARVIGVNSAIATVRGAPEGSSGNIGLGFAIPIDQARRTAQQLIASGKASYPVIGAQVDMQFEGAARVSEVTPGSPAQRAGLRTGDVITKINSQPVGSAEALIVAIRTHRPGESVKLDFERSGKPRQANVTLGAQTG
ncbi:hypothetical protein GCM10009789_65430 [Kribbella sancticallisti]|uniref:PDZ domain-containing protein n=1 Tax=Kribbella sancticallisti TaxID=460087 RepID=A0ABN2EC84_9ACTN